MKLPTLLCSLWLTIFASTSAAQTTAEIRDPAVSGGVADGKVRLVIEGLLSGQPGDQQKLIFSTSIQHWIKANRDTLRQHLEVTFEILQGEAKELPLTVTGEGEIQQITGDALLDWSLRKEPAGGRTLILRPKKGAEPMKSFRVAITVERPLKSWRNPLSTFALTPPQPALSSGFVRVESVPEFDVQPEAPSGFFPIERKYLPAAMQGELKQDEPEPRAFQFHGAASSLPLKITAADPETRRVVLRDFKLTGTLIEQKAAFELTASARVLNPNGGTLTILSGGMALTELPTHPDWRITAEAGRYLLTFDKPGDFPLALKFNAAVRPNGPWNAVDFRVAPSALQPLFLHGLPAETEFQLSGGARPERRDTEFVSFLPPDGRVQLAWKTAAPETEGKLFYSAEMFSQISVGPGLMRQIALLDGKIMQGELDRVTLLLGGAGEVTRVTGEQVLSWDVTPGPAPNRRCLIVRFNQPQKNHFALQVQTQTPLGALPQTVPPLEIRPQGATRFAGYVRIVNEGAVRLEVVEAKGLSQISPEQFPETAATKAAFRAAGAQRFAYRFSGADFALRIQADQILPELTVSQVLAYHLGETELTIDAEIELDIREAPLRELLIRVPRGYAVARLTAPGLTDYFLRDLDGPAESELRIVYGKPVEGRQVVQLRLERNQALGAAEWILPRLEVASTKSVRGHVAVSAAEGFRLTAIRTQSLTEVATAFFPRKIAGLQTAFRISEPGWQATLRVERLPQSIQVDAFHLFSIGEGVAYGSSVLNYVISGAPIAAFKVELSAEYFNVEFTGKEIRNWQKTDGGFVVHLHTPVSGASTLLATYERPFKAQGETLGFNGARPLDAQSEQGHTIVISAFQFQVKPIEVSAGLLPLETGEVPAEYRLFFDAPILAAYRYAARPFDLKLALSPLAQGDSLSQVVDRAALTTRISKEGTALTSAQYFVKSRGNAHFRITLPEGSELWSATVNGAPTVPVKDGPANLIPLPQQADPNAVLTIDVQIADRSKNPRSVKVSTPTVGAPVLLAEWKIEPDTAQRLIYRGGSLTPVGGVTDVSGFAGLTRMFGGGRAVRPGFLLLAAVALLALAVAVWRGTARDGVYKFSVRYWCGVLVGGAAFALAGLAWLSLSELAAKNSAEVPGTITFLAPVQQAGDALFAEVGNVRAEATIWSRIGAAWPVLFALAAFAYGWIAQQSRWTVLGWTLLAWAALRWPNGAGAFLLVVALFAVAHLAIPALLRLWNLPRRAKPISTPPGSGNPAVATAALLLLSLIWASPTTFAQTPAAPPAADSIVVPPKAPPVAETVSQQIQVEEKFAFGSAQIRWQASKGQQLPLIFEPAVLTKIQYPNTALKLVPSSLGGRRAQVLLALEDGVFEIQVEYQVGVTKKEAETGFVLPTQFGLVNELSLTLINLDVDVVAAQAVSIDRKTAGTDTAARLVLAPANDLWIAWKPRSRDVAREKPVFYAEFTQLYTPTAGVIEGLHRVTLRPAQGELGELIFNVPKGTTITDVLDPASAAPAKDKTPASVVQQWRFDPDAGKLRVNLAPPQSRPFDLLIHSQIATGPLPVTQAAGLISVENAAGQIGVLGLATGQEVQLDTVTAETLAAINLEDFPANVAPFLAAQIPGLTVRRAFRYADAKATAVLKASAVEPDVRVESQDTLSLGEDRIVLAVNTAVEITRAGIFRISFALPAGLDVESIAGESMSHWSELKTEAGRIITMHLRGRTEGKQQFTISLAGPGVKAAKAWVAPHLVIREASKQRGTFLVAPEQGMRLQVTTREGITQLDPQKSGIQQKGVLAFRVLQAPWNLAFDIEQVDSWVQVNSLQHATVAEAQVKTVANLQYQIENTGLKSIRVSVPADAENVRFQGDQVADFLPVPNAVPGALKEWEVKLHRRVIGAYLLQVTFQTPVPAQAAEISLRGVQAAEVNLQRGFVTVQAGGRLQVSVAAPPVALQPVEWQSIPRPLQKDVPATSASFAYRLVEPAFVLPMKLERHEVAKLLPARVRSITFTSVVSDNGAMLTQVRLQIIPGDKRLLHFTLPKEAKFWFAFVNQNGVWPWREGDRILLPLEEKSRTGEAIPVSFFYSSEIGKARPRDLDLKLQAPKFDLPLENLTWQVYLDEKWRVEEWSGSLQMQQEKIVSRGAAIDVQTYLRGEVSQQRQKTKAAEQWLSSANNALAQGNPQEARRAFEQAYGLSQHDNAFNEDARVQLHNLKLQQAVVGLNVRNNTISGEVDPVSGKLRAEGQGGGQKQEANYTQQEAKDLIGRNSADDNAAFTRLAERLIQQQDAAVSNPATIEASIPERGRLLTFSRTVAVDHWADLQIGIEAEAPASAGSFNRLVILLATALGLAAFLYSARAFRQRKNVAAGV